MISGAIFLMFPNVSAQSSTSGDVRIIHSIYVDPLPQWASFDSGVVKRAIQAWENANPHLALQQVSSLDNADLHIMWTKDGADLAQQIQTQFNIQGQTANGITLPPKSTKLSYTTIIVTLGNEDDCFKTWQPNSPNTLARILEHEMGHFLGFGHTPNSYALMHSGAPQQYFQVTRSFELPPNSDQSVRMWCAVGTTAKSPTTFNYAISSDDTTGFKFSFLQVNEVNDEPASSPSPVPYAENGCYGQSSGSATGTCSVFSNSILAIKLLDDSSVSNKQLTVKLWPQPSTYLTELEEANAIDSIDETSTHLFNLPANMAGTDMDRQEVQNMKDFPVQYTNDGVRGMMVKNSLVWSNSVIVYVNQSQKSGTINLDFKKTDIDSKVGINDGSLALLSDGSKISWTESDTDTDRSLTINFNGLVDQIIITQPNAQSSTTNNTSQASSISIPSWIKNNAKYWSDGSIDDSTFISGIQYMIKNNIIQIPSTQSSSTTSEEIPSWVKSNAKWWAEGQLSDDDFIKAIQFLITDGIIQINS
jgi:hypothetical protein